METVKSISINKTLRKNKVALQRKKGLVILKKGTEINVKVSKGKVTHNPISLVKKNTKRSETIVNKKPHKTLVKKNNNLHSYKEKPINKFNRLNIRINNKYIKPKKLFNPNLKLMNNIKHFDKLCSEDIYICSVLSKDFKINKI